ncbi:MAG TPA: RhuM family protein [Planctomycetota bacterium]|nr:RhuM family protein [Planctomycetota bacterium]
MESHSGTPRGEVIVYESADGEVRVDVRLEQETVWLTVDQIAELFGRHRTVVLRHLRNVFANKELERSATSAKNAQVRIEGGREIARELEFFNLDAILAVGYRVNSRRGSQFRIWATRTLREHLLRGFTLHEKRLRERGLHEAEQALELLSRTLTTNALVTEEGQAVLEVVQHYSRTWRWLFEYDEDRLPEDPKLRWRQALPSCWQRHEKPSPACVRRSAAAAKPACSSDASATGAWPACSAPSSRPGMGSRSTAAPRSAPLTCCTSS